MASHKWCTSWSLSFQDSGMGVNQEGFSTRSRQRRWLKWSVSDLRKSDVNSVTVCEWICTSFCVCKLCIFETVCTDACTCVFTMIPGYCTNGNEANSYPVYSVTVLIPSFSLTASVVKGLRSSFRGSKDENMNLPPKTDAGGSSSSSSSHSSSPSSFSSSRRRRRWSCFRSQSIRTKGSLG